MAKGFDELQAAMSEASRTRSDALFARHLAELPANDLRHACALSEKTLATVLGIQPARVVKMVEQTDCYLSVLRSHIEAMGGQLEITAKFPAGDVRIERFAGLSAPGKQP